MVFRSTIHAGLIASLASSLLWGGAARAEADAADAAPNGDEIVVTGTKPATEASAGTKSDTPLLETPQSISVIDSSEIAKLGLQNLNQALRFVAGVTPETRGASAEVYDQFKLRGFDAPVYLDGLKLFASATGYAVPQVDISRLDRIEIVKGPASALYGQSGPGGLIVEQSKLPLARDFYGAVSGTYGNYDLYRVDGDIGGRMGQQLLWRVYGGINGADDQQSYGKRRRETVSGAATANIDGRTSLTLLGAYSHDPFNGNYGVFPALGTLIANPAGKISTHFYGGEPGDFFKREQAGLTYIFRHDVGAAWAFRSSGRYQYVKSRLGIVYTSGGPVDFTDPAPTLYSRASYSTREQLNDWTFDNQLTGKFETGALKHSLLVGFDSQVAHSAEVYAFGSATPIDVFDPVYGTMPTPRTPEQVPDPFAGDSNVHQRQQGIYLQDQISVGGLRVTLSGRQDWARQSDGTQKQHNDKFTWRAGALYMTDIGIAPYVSYSTSFEPQAQTLNDGSLAKPSLGKQIEGGVKYQMPGTDFLVTGAWFHIDQSNVVVSDPLTFAAFQVGKVRSRGIEIEASGSLPYGFAGKLAFSRQHVKDVEDVDPTRVGRGLATVGRGGISANLEWAPKSGPAAGFAIGGAVRYAYGTYADHYFDGTAYNTPSYTAFDALMRLDLGKLGPQLAGVTIGINAMNLFDNKYITSCFAQYGWCWYGNRRTVQGTVGFTW